MSIIQNILAQIFNRGTIFVVVCCWSVYVIAPHFMEINDREFEQIKLLNGIAPQEVRIFIQSRFEDLYISRAEFEEIKSLCSKKYKLNVLELGGGTN